MRVLKVRTNGYDAFVAEVEDKIAELMVSSDESLFDIDIEYFDCSSWETFNINIDEYLDQTSGQILEEVEM